MINERIYIQAGATDANSDPMDPFQGFDNNLEYSDFFNQYSVEMYWRYQVTKEIAVTPSLQYINDPALNLNQNNLWAYGLRLRYTTCLKIGRSQIKRSVV